MNEHKVRAVVSRIAELRQEAKKIAEHESYAGHMGASQARPLQHEADGMEGALRMLGLIQ